MTFQVSQAAFDILSGRATVAAAEPTPPGPGAGPPKIVRLEFPFTPPVKETDELKMMVIAAKALLQQAANDL